VDDATKVLQAIRALEEAQSVTLEDLCARIARIEGAIMGKIDGRPGLHSRMDRAEREIEALVGRQVWAERMTWGAIVTAALTVVAAILLRGIGAA
jgi:hypothetical protein